MAISDAPQIGIIETLRTERRLPSPQLARAIRLDAGATQKQLADALGCDRVSVTRWETGVRRPRGERAVAYAKLLGELAELVAEERRDR